MQTKIKEYCDVQYSYVPLSLARLAMSSETSPWPKLSLSIAAAAATSSGVTFPS